MDKTNSRAAQQVQKKLTSQRQKVDVSCAYRFRCFTIVRLDSRSVLGYCALGRGQRVLMAGPQTWSARFGSLAARDWRDYPATMEWVAAMTVKYVGDKLASAVGVKVSNLLNDYRWRWLGKSTWQSSVALSPCSSAQMSRRISPLLPYVAVCTFTRISLTRYLLNFKKSEVRYS